MLVHRQSRCLSPWYTEWDVLCDNFQGRDGSDGWRAMKKGRVNGWAAGPRELNKQKKQLQCTCLHGIQYSQTPGIYLDNEEILLENIIDNLCFQSSNIFINGCFFFRAEVLADLRLTLNLPALARAQLTDCSQYQPRRWNGKRIRILWVCYFHLFLLFLWSGRDDLTQATTEPTYGTVRELRCYGMFTFVVCSSNAYLFSIWFALAKAWVLYAEWHLFWYHAETVLLGTLAVYEEERPVCGDVSECHCLLVILLQLEKLRHALA